MAEKTKDFKPATEVVVPDEERAYQRKFSDVLRLLDVAFIKADEVTPEGWGKNVEVSIDGFSIRISSQPPPRSGDGGRGGGRPPAKFDKAGIQAIIMANPDLLDYKDLDGGRVQVKPKKFLADLWTGINGDLQKYGMAWVKDPADKKNGRWEGGP